MANDATVLVPFNAEEYVRKPCPFPIGSNERFEVYSRRFERCVDLHMEGDTTEALPAYQQCHSKARAGQFSAIMNVAESYHAD